MSPTPLFFDSFWPMKQNKESSFYLDYQKAKASKMLLKEYNDIKSRRWQHILYIDVFLRKERKQVFSLQRFELVRLSIIQLYIFFFFFSLNLYFLHDPRKGEVKSLELSLLIRWLVQLICFVTCESENDEFERATMVCTFIKGLKSFRFYEINCMIKRVFWTFRALTISRDITSILFVFYF